MSSFKDGPVPKTSLLATISFLVSCVFVFSGLFNGFELAAYDFFSRSVNPHRASDDIVIVEVDQASIDILSREGITWPWPRQMYAPIVDFMSEAEAVFIDILFTESSSYGEEDDEIFAESVKKAGNIYLPVFLSDNRLVIDEADRRFLEKIAIPPVPPALSFASAIPPIPRLRSSVAGSGNVTIPPGEDGVYRTVPLVFEAGGLTIPHFVLGHLLQEGEVVAREGALFRGETKIPLLKDRLILRYYREDKPFETVSAVTVLKASVESDSSKTATLKKEDFKGKKIFIGLTAAGLYDLKPTAVSSMAPGVLIHATTLDNLASGGFLKPMSPIFVLIFMGLLTFLIASTVIKSPSLLINLAVFAGLLVIAIGVPAVSFSMSWYMTILPSPLALVTGFLITTAYSYAVEGKERRFVKRTFSQYMDKTIVDHILKNPEVIKAGGERKRVTIFFADIAGFTTMAEKIPPEETGKILNTVLNAFTEVIISNRGVIDKYVGDCVMAFWGAPVEIGQEEISAVTAALECQSALREINDRFDNKGLPTVTVRIGIHSGEAIVGNLGSDRLFDYTVVGDSVNIASRLEWANKLFGTGIIVSEGTFKRTGDRFLVRDLGLIEVTGKNIPTRVFEIVAEKSKADLDQENTVAQFKKGMSLFTSMKWKAALEAFNDVLETAPADGPAKFYIRRVHNLMAKASLPDGWEIFRMAGK